MCFSLHGCVCLVIQSCPTLCDPMDYSPPGSSVHGILQPRILEWVAISFSRGSSRPRDRIQVSRIVDRRFTVNPCVGKIPWRREWQPIPVFLPGEFHGQRRLAGYSPWDWRVRNDWVTDTHMSEILKGKKAEVLVCVCRRSYVYFQNFGKNAILSRAAWRFEMES